MPVLYVFLVKLFLTVMACIAEYVLWKRYDIWQKVFETHKPLIISTIVFITRIIPFIVVFVLVKELPRGDIPFFYYKASHALQLDMVYKDFWSFHAPLFSYFLALPLLIVHHPSSIVALMLVGEVFCAIYTYQYYQKIDSSAFRKLVHYLIMPAPMIICLFGGQEDIWLWGFALWGLNVLIKTQNEWKFGLVIALALLSLKVTFAFFLFPLFFLLKNKTKFIGALCAVGIPSLMILYNLVGWDFLMLIKHTEDPYSPNLFSVLRPLFGHSVDITKMNWIGLALFLSLATWIGYQARNKDLQQAFPLLFVITFGLMQLFLPSAMAYYMFIYFIVLVFDQWQTQDIRYLVLLLGFNLLLVVQPFVYVYLKNPVFASFTALSSPMLLLEYLLELAFVVLLTYTIWKTYHKLQKI